METVTYLYLYILKVSYIGQLFVLALVCIVCYVVSYCSMLVSFINRFAASVATYAAGYGMCTAITTPAILEMHGDTYLAIIFGLQMLLHGVGNSISPPFTGKVLDLLLLMVSVDD